MEVRSASGCTVLSWAPRQATFALSSTEAELYRRTRELEAGSTERGSCIAKKNSAHLFLSTKMLIFEKHDLFEGTRFFLHSHNVVEKVGLKPCMQQTRPG